MDVYNEIIKHWAINGDTINFKELDGASYDMMRGRLTRYAYTRLKDWMDAEDAVNDAYVHVLSYPPKGDHHNFGGLYKLYLDRAIANIRSKNNNRNSVLQEDEQVAEDNVSEIDNTQTEELSPELAVDIVNQTNIIMDMSDRLKPKQKAIVRLALIFGYSYREIQDITKTSVKTIDNTISYFRKKIKENPKYEDLRTTQ